MSGTVLQDMNCLKKDNIIFSQNITGEERVLVLTPIMGYSRFRMDYEAGILYLGKQRFSLATWDYQLPKWMRIQGRSAKETFSIYNNSLWECFTEGELKFHVRRACDECRGPLRMNADGDYYCKDCGLMMDDIMLPGYDSIRQSTTMKDHNYNDPIL